jgi:hypothetical protein
VRSLREYCDEESYIPAFSYRTLSPSRMEQGMIENDAQDGQGSAAVDMSYSSFKLHELSCYPLRCWTFLTSAPWETGADYVGGCFGYNSGLILCIEVPIKEWR